MLFRVYSLILALCIASAAPLAAVAAEPLWIDVRSAGEYSDMHVEQAVNIPYDEIANGILGLTTDRDAIIYLYCRSGRRSGIALETLQGMGYTQVVNLGGLEDALKKSGQENTP